MLLMCTAALATLWSVVFLSRARLSEVLKTQIPPGVDGIGGVTHDSRLVEPGFAFVAIPGMRRDGVEFVPEALRRGAALVVAERELPPGSPSIVVSDARDALAALARAVFRDPSASLAVYGVTGTNGKTTTSYALYSILAVAYGPEKCGLMTTAEVMFGNERQGERRIPARTTPEATEVQGTLRKMLDGGVENAVLEVSSHGVSLKRVTGTHFAGAIFTNLTRDHLDLHGSMEEYYRAKRELFHWVGTRGPKLANADDSYGRRIAEEVPGVGRFGFEVIVDYAHTDVALEAALNVAREVADAGGGRVLCVFGAAGDRDVAKRPLMGRVATSLAESSIITTDDAYTEDPEKIAHEVAAGAEDGRYEVVLDRRGG